MMRITKTIVFLNLIFILLLAQAQADPVYVSQSRSVSVSAQVNPTTQPSQSGGDSRSAPDFTPFDQSITTELRVIESFDGGSRVKHIGAYANSRQTSAIGPTVIDELVAVFLWADTEFDLGASAYSSASSTFSVTFRLDEPYYYLYRQDYTPGNYVSRSAGLFDSNGPVAVLQNTPGILPPGQYTLYDSLTSQAIYDSAYQSSSDHLRLELTAVPEPISLFAVGPALMIGLLRRRR